MDKELLARLRGEYSTSFYRIFMDGKYDQDLSRMSQKDLGTFVHEYIHYVQNISTLWGMYESMIRYQCIAEAKEELEHINDIPLLYKFNFSETLRKRLHVLKIGLGEECFDRYSNKRIELDKGIDILKEFENCNDKNFEKYYLEFLKNEEIIDSIYIENKREYDYYFDKYPDKLKICQVNDLYGFGDFIVLDIE